jgi:hypothetical protein
MKWNNFNSERLVGVFCGKLYISIFNIELKEKCSNSDFLNSTKNLKYNVLELN